MEKSIKDREQITQQNTTTSETYSRNYEFINCLYIYITVRFVRHVIVSPWYKYMYVYLLMY